MEIEGSVLREYKRGSGKESERIREGVRGRIFKIKVLKMLGKSDREHYIKT